jgi:hypothetical protein
VIPSKCREERGATFNYQAYLCICNARRSSKVVRSSSTASGLPVSKSICQLCPITPSLGPIAVTSRLLVYLGLEDQASGYSTISEIDERAHVSEYAPGLAYGPSVFVACWCVGWVPVLDLITPANQHG